LLRTKNYKDEGNPEKDEKSRAMDFFDGLDKVRYGDFKNHILNCIDTGTLMYPLYIIRLPTGGRPIR
jgi:hypothetical protein